MAHIKLRIFSCCVVLLAALLIVACSPKADKPHMPDEPVIVEGAVPEENEQPSAVESLTDDSEQKPEACTPAPEPVPQENIAGIELKVPMPWYQSTLSNPRILWGSIGLLFAVLAFIGYAFTRRHSHGKATADDRSGLVNAQSSASVGIRAANIQGIGAREDQQDAFGITDVADTNRGVFVVVADGMGGTANGAEISHIVTSQMLQVFQSAQSPDPASLLLRMASAAQSEARAFIERHGNKISGSTVVSAIIKDGGLYFLSVGDSRICLLRGGALIQLNREHTCASRLDERAARGEISLAEARNDPQRGALISFIGLEGELQIDSNPYPIPVVKGDRLLLMSDGVFGTLADSELTELARVPSVYEAGAAIERAIDSKRKPNQDNFTAILLEL